MEANELKSNRVFVFIVHIEGGVPLYENIIICDRKFQLISTTGVGISQIIAQN